MNSGKEEYTTHSNNTKFLLQVWSLAEEDRQEDGDLPALQVHLHLLWQGQDEEKGRITLESGFIVLKNSTSSCDVCRCILIMGVILLKGGVLSPASSSAVTTARTRQVIVPGLL